METILIREDGTILKNGRAYKGPALKLLGCGIETGEKFLLRSVFRMVRAYPDLVPVSDMLPSLLEIEEQNRVSGIKTPEIDGLIFYKTIEIKGFPGNPGLVFYNSLKGVSKEKRIELKFFHPETLLDHQLDLGLLNHVVFGDTEARFQYETVYTLFEFVEGIAWGLSFNFNPLECAIRR